MSELKVVVLNVHKGDFNDMKHFRALDLPHKFNITLELKLEQETEVIFESM